ncbi:MAG: PepSY-associated TM helix domain-containing protein [Pseudomonadota bacterium]
MDRDRRVRIYDAHSWTGISLGLFLFVVCFTGSVAMFHNELMSWEDPNRRIALSDAPVSGDELMRTWAAEYPLEDIEFISLWYPTDREPYFQGRLTIHQDEGGDLFKQRRWNSQSGELLPDRESGLSTWLLGIHRDLMWPDVLGGRTIGRGLVGIAGIIMLLSIVTGIITHRKILREFFTFRRTRTVRLKWKDAHNVLGTWTLPFSIMIAFSGAWLGIVALLLPITGALVFKGDTAKLIEIVAPGPGGRTGEAMSPISFDELALRRHPESGKKLAGVFVTNWGDSAARYQLSYYPDGELKYYEVEQLDASGETVPLVGTLAPMASSRVVASLSPLHYGTYGGLALKYLYFALGIGLSVMVALGNMVWIERRWHSAEGQQSPAFYARLSKLTVGVCMGVVLATVAVFYADPFYRGDEEGRLAYVGWAYFAAWFLVILAAFRFENSYRSMRLFMALTGIGLLGLPLVSAFVGGAAPWTLVDQGHYAAPLTDLTFLVLGALTLWVTVRLPRERLEQLGRRASRKARLEQEAPATG